MSFLEMPNFNRHNNDYAEEMLIEYVLKIHVKTSL